jgi:serine protease Do
MKKVVSGAILILIGFAGGAVLSHPEDLHKFTFSKLEKKEDVLNEEKTSTSPEKSQECSTLPSFVEIVKKVKPAVVNIKATKVVKTQPSPFFRWYGDPFEEFFRRFFEGIPREHVERSLGSGFIIDEEGYVLTNYHVVGSASEIKVSLESGKEFDAEIIGTDQKTDIALIKIKSKGPFPVIKMGDSDKLEIGEWVIAIGNPFGLGHTVTAGIVSAKERVLGTGPYDAYIQTDAPINPGNSGGPLINTKGEVVGINAIIYSPTGIPQNIGIGFAIPINLAKSLLEQLKKGKVVRGWLGVYIQEVTQDIAESLGMKEPAGALVSEVMKGSPAEEAGIKRGDVIIGFAGKEIKSSRELPAMVASTEVGKVVDVKVLRDGKPITIKVKIGKMPEEGEVVAKTEEEGVIEEEKIGLRVQNLTKEMAESLGISEPYGVIVTDVLPNSPAENAGFQRGDVIVEVNRKVVRDVDEFKTQIEKALEKKVVLFLVKRGRATIYIALKLR